MSSTEGGNHDGKAESRKSKISKFHKFQTPYRRSVSFGGEGNNIKNWDVKYSEHTKINRI